jgi:hypothetical protein
MTWTSSASSLGRWGWEVIVDPDDESRHRAFHVPQDQLAAFLLVLASSGFAEFRVRHEQTPTQRSAQSSEPE